MLAPTKKPAPGLLRGRVVHNLASCNGIGKRYAPGADLSRKKRRNAVGVLRTAVCALKTDVCALETVFPGAGTAVRAGGRGGSEKTRPGIAPGAGQFIISRHTPKGLRAGGAIKRPAIRRI
jgi:hypothetical protein